MDPDCYSRESVNLDLRAAGILVKIWDKLAQSVGQIVYDVEDGLACHDFGWE